MEEILSSNEVTITFTSIGDETKAHCGDYMVTTFATNEFWQNKLDMNS